MPETLLYVAILLVGLAAGLFVGWSVSVIPGTRRTGDATYLETMQHINTAIVNPAFMVIFIGPAFALVASAVALFGDNQSDRAWFVVAATVVYVVGTLGVTIAGNVPLNNVLDAVDLSRSNETSRHEDRATYEGSWNRLHYLRSASSLVAFALALVGAL